MGQNMAASSAVRRILLGFAAAALVAAIAAFGSASAFAQDGCTEAPPSGPEALGRWTVTCVETVVVTEEVRTPTTQECVVGNSGREGTQEGDLVRTDEVTKQTTTKTLYQGHPSNNNLVVEEGLENPSSSTVESRVEGEPTFEPTGLCRNIPGRQ